MARPTTDSENNFVEWLTTELRRKGMSRQKLCELSGIDSGQMSRIMNRDTVLSFENAIRMAPHLDVSPIAMFVAAELIDPPKGLTAAETELIESYRALNDDGRDVLAILMKSLHDKYAASNVKTGRSDRSKSA